MQSTKCLRKMIGQASLTYYRIAGNFRREIISWFSIIKFICGKKFVVYSSVLSQLNHKIKSSWVKHSWFYLNHENHEIFSPRKFPAIRYEFVTAVTEIEFVIPLSCFSVEDIEKSLTPSHLLIGCRVLSCLLV